MAATNRRGVTAVVFALNCILAYLNALPQFQPGDILHIFQSHCIVLAPENVLTDSAYPLISSLADVSFSHESGVLFGTVKEVPFKWPNGRTINIQGGPSDEDLQRSILVVKQLKRDRSCLLVPEDNFVEPLVSHHKLQSEESDVARSRLLDFINQNCGTFCTYDGSLNIAGLHRKEILHNLYSTETRNDQKAIEFGHCVEKRDADKHHRADICKQDIVDEGETICSYSVHKGYFSDEGLSHQIEECEKIDVPSPSEFFHEYLSRSKPVIIKGATKHWRALQKWTKEFLRRKYGHKRVHVKLTPDANFEGVESITLWEEYENLKIPKSVYEQLPYPDLVVVRPASAEIHFSDFLDLIENVSLGTVKNMSAYLEYSSITDYFPELSEDITEMPFFLDVLELKHLNIWLSDGNTLGKLHFDPFDNFLCQISGEKQVLLFEPHDNTRLYEGHIQEAQLTYNKSEKVFYRRKLLESTSMVMSPLDPLKRDLQRFPKFTHVKPLNCSIKSGDVLFMPSFWWHEVQSKPDELERRNLAVNFWYEPFLTREFPCPDCKLDVNPKYFHLL